MAPHPNIRYKHNTGSILGDMYFPLLEVSENCSINVQLINEKGLSFCIVVHMNFSLLDPTMSYEGKD